VMAMVAGDHQTGIGAAPVATVIARAAARNCGTVGAYSYTPPQAIRPYSSIPFSYLFSYE
jgi:hypothetical protein